MVAKPIASRLSAVFAVGFSAARRKSARGDVVNPNDFFSRVQGLTSGTRHYFRTTVRAQLRGLHVQRYNVAWPGVGAASGRSCVQETVKNSLAISLVLLLSICLSCMSSKTYSPFVSFFFPFFLLSGFSRRTRTSVRRNR